MPAKLGLLLLLVSVLAACGGTQASRKAATPATPAAYETRWVATHGIELAVPAAWPDNKGQCGTPTANTVMWNEDAISLCLIRQPPGLSVVEFGGWAPPQKGKRTTIGGLAVRELGHTGPESRWVQLVVLRHHITVTVFSPHPAVVRQIVGSLHAVRVDHNGCPTQTPSGGYRRGAGPAPGTPLVPAGPVRVVACSYATRWIDRSNRLGRSAAARLARALDAAPSGFSHPPATDYLPSICGSTWRASRIVARFAYEHRSPVVVTAHIDGCSRLGASNGGWAVQMKQGWVYRLVGDANYGGSFADPRRVR